jgi:hypothetical protein
MTKHIKIFTDESRVHGQIDALEKILSRRLECEITINVKDTSSSIQFEVSENEMEMIQKEPNLHFLVRQGGHWLPLI